MPNVSSVYYMDDSQTPEQIAAQNAADFARFRARQAEQQAEARTQAIQAHNQLLADRQAIINQLQEERQAQPLRNQLEYGRGKSGQTTFYEGDPGYAANIEAMERDRLYNESRSALSALGGTTAQQYVRPEESAQLEGKTVGESMDLLNQINARGNAATQAHGNWMQDYQKQSNARAQETERLLANMGIDTTQPGPAGLGERLYDTVNSVLGRENRRMPQKYDYFESALGPEQAQQMFPRQEYMNTYEPMSQQGIGYLMSLPRFRDYYSYLLPYLQQRTMF